jgi:hypothetical protein
MRRITLHRLCADLEECLCSSLVLTMAGHSLNMLVTVRGHERRYLNLTERSPDLDIVSDEFSRSPCSVRDRCR